MRRCSLPLRLGSFRALAKQCLPIGIALGIVALCLLVAAPTAHAQWPWSDKAPVGSPEWWKHNKRSATFDPDKGYSVEGVEGYFDGDGRPITAPISTERVIEAGETKDSEGLIPGLNTHAQMDKLKTAVGLGPNEQFAREAYAEGVQLHREGKYSAAATKFKHAINRGPHSSVEQDSRLMLAECYFFERDFVKARDAYDELVKEHPNTRYMDRVIQQEWLIARYWEEEAKYNYDWPLTPNFFDKTRPWFDTVGHAVKTYDNIRLNDPTGPRADDAILATANNYFSRERYEDADYNYSLLRSQYPQSEHQYEAHLLGLESKLRKYQGEDYDGTPLEESKSIVKQLRTQFGSHLSAEEKERLRVKEGHLNLEIATRNYRMAEYYDGTKHYGAAKKYYGEVIKEYPDSELATKSRERVAALAGAADTPNKPLGTIVDLFPESPERARVARIPELQKGGRLAERPGNAAPATTTK